MVSRRDILKFGGVLLALPSLAFAEDNYAPDDVDVIQDDKPVRIIAPHQRIQINQERTKVNLTTDTKYPRTLWVKREKELELLDVYTADGYKRLCWLTRDIRANNTVGTPSPKLVRQTVWLQSRLKYYGYNKPLILMSGLRTKHTNETTEGAVRASKHLPNSQMIFNAFDLEMPGVKSSILATLALEAHDGGVGYYGDDRHIHIDDGKTRFWRSKNA